MQNEHGTSFSSLMDNTAEITEETLGDDPGVDERRKFSRRAARWPVSITTKDKTVVHCRTRDVSEKGASISSPYDFNINALIILEIQIVYKKIRKTIRALAQVKHSSVASDGFTIGVFIKDTSEPASNFLKAYSNKQL